MAETADGKGGGVASGGRCPICKAPTQHETRPFCSRRCANIDLSRWLSGAYVIDGGGLEDADEDGDLGRVQAMSGREPDAESDDT